jgi:Cys-tRNA(Pro) deacylase
MIQIRFEGSAGLARTLSAWCAPLSLSICATEPITPPAPYHLVEMTSGPMHPNLARVVEAAAEAGHAIRPRRFPDGTRTAADAARAVGCEIGQIVKSLVFVADGEPVVALVSGPNRADVARLGSAVGATEVRRADANEVRDATGFAIGGVPPFGHTRRLRVVVDADLVRFDVVFAAAGLPDATFAIAPTDLVTIATGNVAEIAERATPAAG